MGTRVWEGSREEEMPELDLKACLGFNHQRREKECARPGVPSPQATDWYPHLCPVHGNIAFEQNRTLVPKMLGTTL